MTVRMLTSKWPDLPHWEFDAVILGDDAHGRWLGVTAGTQISRPGLAFAATCDQVVLVPADRWWTATMYGRHPLRPFDCYVDITSRADWGADDVHVIDLDLDVIKGTHGRVWIDDEDEFAERRHHYPEIFVTEALHAVEWVRRSVEAATGPFAPEVAESWIARIRDLSND